MTTTETTYAAPATGNATTIDENTTATTRPTETATTNDDAWVEAGDAWGHAAVDWAYRFEPYAADAIDAVFDRLDVGAGTDLVDIACGSGLAAGRASRRGSVVAGLDASRALIDIARRRAPEADLRVGDMFDLPWADHSFDVATSFNGVWGGCTAALVEAARVLRPGGTLGITFWGPGDRLDMRDYFIALGTSMPEMGGEMKGLASIGAPGVVEGMLAEAGFDLDRRWEVPSIVELADEDAAWRALRSPGLVLPALRHLGDDELRRRLMPTLEPFRAADGSYRIVNELTCVTARRTSMREGNES